MSTTVQETGEGLKRELGLFSAVALVSGVMIGSGIFIVSADIARQLQSPGWMLLNWLFAAVVTLFGAMSYGKLAQIFPDAGGQYVFLKKTWGELPAFLYGWALFFVIQTGTLAAVAVAFAKFLGVLVPWVSSQTFLLSLGAFHLTSQQLVAMGVLGVLTAYNCFGVKQGAILQNVFTVLKVLALLGVIAAGCFLSTHGLPNPSQWSLEPVGPLALPLFSLFAVSTVGSLFSADAWNNVTFMGGEIKDPAKNVPKAMFWGTLVVLMLYLLANIAYLNVLPFAQIQTAPEDRVATAVMNALWGPSGAIWMAMIILVSTFGCLNGMILAGARVVYTMAQDKLFFAPFAKVHPRFYTPILALIGQGIIAGLLTLTGSYGQLLDYTLFTILLFYIVTVLGLLRFVQQRPDALPHWSPLNYVVPVTYIVLLTYVCLNLAMFKPGYTLPGLGIVAAGIPIYFAWKALYK